MLSLGMRGLAITLKTLQVIALIRMYGVQQFGVYSIAIGIFTLALVLGRLGLDHYSQREANRRVQDAYEKTVGISLTVAAPCLAVAILSLGATYLFYSIEVFKTYCIFVATTPIYAIVWNQLFILRGAGWINTSMFLFEILNPILLLGFAYILNGFELGLPLAFLAATLVMALATYLKISKLLDGSPARIASLTSMKATVSASKHFYAMSILEAVHSLADSLAVGFFLRPIDVAIYAIITRVGTVAILPVTITSIYINNIVARLSSSPLRATVYALRSFVLLNFVISMFAAVAAMTLLPYISLIFKVEFPPEAKWAYIAVISAQFVNGSTAFVRSIMYMSGREHYISRIALLLLIPYILALVLMTADQGLLFVGLAFATTLVINRFILGALLFRAIWQERPGRT